MKLSEIVPWGRSLAEYQLMFSLADVGFRRSTDFPAAAT
jgi:hypothetical protein